MTAHPTRKLQMVQDPVPKCRLGWHHDNAGTWLDSHWQAADQMRYLMRYPMRYPIGYPRSYTKGYPKGYPHGYAQGQPSKKLGCKNVDNVNICILTIHVLFSHCRWESNPCHQSYKLIFLPLDQHCCTSEVFNSMYDKHFHPLNVIWPTAFSPPPPSFITTTQ